MEGEPGAFLPLLHHVLLGYSRPLATRIVEKGYELAGKPDLRFAEAAFKLLREVFEYRPPLTPTQFLQRGYAERKLLLVHEVASRCLEWHARAVRRAKLERLKPSGPRSVFMRLPAGGAAGGPGAVGAPGAPAARGAAAPAPAPPSGADPSRRVWEADTDDEEFAGRTFDVPAAVSPVALERQRESLFVDRAHLSRASAARAWGPGDSGDGGSGGGGDDGGSDISEIHPADPFAAPAPAPRPAPAQAPAPLAPPAPPAPPAPRPAPAPSPSGNGQAVVQHLLSLTQAMHALAGRVKELEESQAAQMERVAGHLCVLETRVRQLEAAGGAAVGPRPAAGKPASEDLAASQDWAGAAAPPPAPAAAPAPAPRAAPELSEPYGPPRTVDELTGAAHGELVPRGEDLAGWIAAMEGRFADTREVLSSLGL